MNIPDRIKRLPVDKRGYPVPWFVAWINGEPDFRVVDPDKVVDAVQHSLCFICGQPLGRYKAFVIGPMCAINRVSSEPPSHRECAVFSAQACPFLTNPKQVRRETALPDQIKDPGGLVIERNPGVSLVWVTTKYKPFKAPGGVLYDVGEPEETIWFVKGRTATREEILHSIETGLPTLREAAELDGPDALELLEAQRQKAMELVP